MELVRHVMCDHVSFFTSSARSLVKRRDRSCRGHQCSETSLTGEPSSIVSEGASPGREPLPPLARSKWLTHWTSDTVYGREAAGHPDTSISCVVVIHGVFV